MNREVAVLFQYHLVRISRDCAVLIFTCIAFQVCGDCVVLVFAKNLPLGFVDVALNGVPPFC